MRTFSFLFITLVSGATAGAILGLINLAVVEPVIDQAIGIELNNDINADQSVNMDEIAGYRIWQKGGEVVGGIIYGISLSSLFGIVFAYSRKSLPGNNAKTKAIFLASILCLILFIVPALKYPSNPPAVGDPDTIYYRQGLFVAFLFISGVSALAVAIIAKKLNQTASRKAMIAGALYGTIMTVTYLVMPPNPDQISISMNLIDTFRVVSGSTIVMFWAILGSIFGALWQRFEPDKFERITAF
jgi:predicted cobalt transporter CbtA